MKLFKAALILGCSSVCCQALCRSWTLSRNLMNTLSEYQQKFVDEVYPECREAMADYLSRGVDDAFLEAKNLGLNVVSVMGYKV